jgi:hypothetical protein
MTRRRRQVLIGIVAALLLVVSGVVALNLSGEREEDEGLGEGDLPPLISRHLEALPENGGLEGPAGSADAAFLERAYPSDTITVAQTDASKAAFSGAKGRPFPRGKGQKGTWTTIGPDQAVYPFTPLRNAFNYVPNEYIAGGRTTAIAISDTCVPTNCRMWITPAGGGVWRTTDALADPPKWTYVGGPLGINAAGAVSIDKNDPTGNTIYVGTGEANTCGSGCVAGAGLYKSTDGGDTWTGPLGKPELGGKGIGDIVVKPGDPQTIYVGTTTALRGMSSVCCSGVTRPVPDAAQWGLFKSTDGGATWVFIHNGSTNAADCTGSAAEFTNGTSCSPRGVRQVELDPSDPNILYASSYARGVWRSNDAGATWTQVKAPLSTAVIPTRSAFDVVKLANGNTRMYVHEGNQGQQFSRLSRSDDVATGTPTFINLTSNNVADSGWAFYNLCSPGAPGTGQCWYDLFVTASDSNPDIVYAGGSYSYGQTVANKRGVVLSTDAGVTGTDMTFDGTDQLHPNGLHPDQHDLVVNPNNPFQFFETSDGGVMRSSGSFLDRSAWCSDPNRRLSGAALGRCQQMLSRIPSKLDSLNKGLNTLQFQSLSVSPLNSGVLQGGTQDNGTWQTTGNPSKWYNMMIGDGGQSGFDVAVGDFRFHTFTGTAIDVNFNKGTTADWIYAGGGQMGTDGGTQFYAPVINDPTVSGTMFAGSGVTAYRTKTFGLGTRTLQEANAVCNEWTGSSQTGAECGDFTRLGTVPLTSATWGDRAGPAVAAIERTAADKSTAWAATTTGRVFITRNVDAEPASAVSWTRLDDDAVTPNRFVSSVYVDPANGNHAWISYSGYSSNTPATPGHIFEVTYDPGTGTSSWVDRSYDFGDLPVTDLLRDGVTGDLYASCDFGVLRLAAGTTTWTAAAPGMPNVEVAGLTILPQERILYAASHGMSAWRLNLEASP